MATNWYSEELNMQIQNNFAYHESTNEQACRYAKLRESAKVLAEMINHSCPPSRERAVAITKLEETVMWAIAAILRNERWGDGKD